MSDRILLIEDDHALATQITQQLRDDKFDVDWWKEGALVSPARASRTDLIILDLMLPNLYGMDILKDLRTFSDLPVMVLSGRNDTLDKVRALKVGADDYMTKPFWPEELLERVRARLRRPHMQRKEALLVANLELDLVARTVKQDNMPVELTRVEFDLLAALARRPGAAVSRRWLVDHIIDPERGTERTLDVHFSRLRKKLGSNNGIETVWGVGYRLNPGEGA